MHFWVDCDIIQNWFEFPVSSLFTWSPGVNFFIIFSAVAVSPISKSLAQNIIKHCSYFRFSISSPFCDWIENDAKCYKFNTLSRIICGKVLSSPSSSIFYRQVFIRFAPAYYKTLNERVIKHMVIGWTTKKRKEKKKEKNRNCIACG